MYTHYSLRDMDMQEAQITVLDYNIEDVVNELIALGYEYHQRGWCLGTSGNFSVVLNRDPLHVLITASGKDKSRLTRDDFVIVDETGSKICNSNGKPSAETQLHLAAILNGNAGAVLHTHSIWATVLSHKFIDKEYLQIEGFEMLKGLSGIQTHDTTVSIPIFKNQQEMDSFREKVESKFKTKSENMKHAYLIEKHGMHAWGSNLVEAKRHVEIMEFLLEAIARLDGGQ